MRDPLAPINIGREGVATADPLNELRGLLGEDYADRFDTFATFSSRVMASKTDQQLARQERQLKPLFDALDVAQVREDQVQDYRLEKAQSAWLAAEEERTLAEAFGASEDEISALWRREDPLQTSFLKLANARDASTNQGRTVGNWFDRNYLQLGEWMAGRRELAIRQAIRERDRGVRGAGLPENPHWPFKEIGAGDYEKDLELLPAEPGVRRTVEIDPDSLVIDSSLDRLRDVIGDERLERLAAPVESVTDWAKLLPPAWLEARTVELGPPGDGIHRRTALEAQRREFALRVVERQRDDAKAEQDRYQSERNVPMATYFANEAHHHEERRAELVREADAFAKETRDNGTSLDTYLEANRDRLVLSAAYHDVLERRREHDLTVRVEEHVLAEVRYVTKQIGRAPETGTLHHERWQEIARDIARERIVADDAKANGIDPPERAVYDDLDRLRKIEEYRAAQGLPELPEQTQQLAVETSGHDVGH